MEHDVSFNRLSQPAHDHVQGDEPSVEGALRESERKYRLLFENMTAAFALHEIVVDEQGQPLDYRFLEVNPAFARLTGITADAVIGRTVKELMPGTEQYWIDVYGRVALTGEPITYQNYAQELGKYYDAFAFSPERGKFAVVFTDISARKRAEDAVRRAERALSAITACNQAIVRALGEVELLRQVCQAIADAGHYPLAWIGYKRDDADRTIQPVAWAGPAAAYVQQITDTWADLPLGQGPAGKAVRTGRTQVMQNLLEDPDYRPWRQAAAGQGFATSIGIPLLVEGLVVGLLNIYAPEPDAFDQEEQRLLERLADDISYGIAALRIRAEREQVAAALRTSEAQFRAIFEQASVGIARLTLDGRWLQVNDRTCDLLGYSRAELLQVRAQDLTHPDDLPEALVQVDRFRRGEMPRLQRELRFVRKDGGVIWVSMSVGPVRVESSGELQGVAVLEDITARKVAQQAQERAKRALAAVSACNQAVAQESDEVQLLQEICEAVVASGGYLLAWVGYAEHDEQRSVKPIAVAGPAAAYLHTVTVSWAEVPSGLGPAGHAIRSGIPQVMRHLAADPIYRPWLNYAEGLGIGSIMAVPLSVEGTELGALALYAAEPDAFDGEEQQVLARLASDLSHGITSRRARAERERAALALRTSEARFRAMFEQAGVGIALSDVTGTWRMVNARQAELLGYEAAELEGRHFRDFIHPEERAADERLDRQIRAGLITKLEAENRYLHRSGRDVWMRVSVGSFLDDAGIYQGAVAMFQDITARKQAEDALHSSERLLRLFIESAPAAIAMFDRQMRYLAASRRYLADYQLTGRDIIGRSHYEIFPDLPEHWKAIHRRCLAGAVESAEEDPFPRAAGTLDWVRWEIHPWYERPAEIGGIMLFSELITARKQAESALEAAAAENALLAAAVETTTVGVVVTDPTLADNPIIYVNQAYLEITGYRESEVLGRNPRFLQGEGTSAATRQALHDAVIAGRAFAGQVLNYRKDGTPIWNEVRITPITDARGAVRNWVGLKTDVTQQMRLQAELERLALHDQLTGLPNRALLLDRTTQAILQAARQHQHAALLLLDLDHFKEVNDTFGHAVGDSLLQYTAQILLGALRATDTVARLGGDEFAVLLPSTDAQGAVKAAATLQGMLSEPLVLEHQTLRPDSSIGIALYPEHGVDAAALLQHADVAMYQAKRARRSSSIYQPEHDLHTPDRAVLLEDLRQAIDRSQLRLHYQPLVQVATGTVTAVEALLRWEHPERGLLHPDAFLPLVESFGIQGQVTRWVLMEAVCQQREWQERGLDLAVQINLATSDLHDEGVITDIVSTLQVPGRQVRLCLELTEGALMGDLAYTRTVLLRLAAVGAQIAIDDYGTGYSSLSRLARLPVDQLKIDRLFVQGMTENPVDASIVASTVGLAHSVGVPVVAEGVEDETTLKQLRNLGCDMVQGYFHTRPLPPLELERWLYSRGVAGHS